MSIEEIRRALTCGKPRCSCTGVGPKRLSHCPAHDDTTPSLSVTEQDGRILVHCHAGCSQNNVIAALRERGIDLSQQSFPAEYPKPGNWETSSSTPRKVKVGTPGHRAEHTYPYCDDQGTVKYTVVRTEWTDEEGIRQKGICVRNPEGASNIDGIRRVLYHLPEVLETKEESEVYVVEGENKVDRLRQYGYVATCNLGGAGKWRDDYSPAMQGKRVRILPDADPVGRAHALQVARSVSPFASEVKIVELPGLAYGEDIIDWLNKGHNPCEIEGITDSTPPWVPDDPADSAPASVTDDIYERARIVRLDTVQTRAVKWFWRGRIPFGKITIIDGDPGMGKSTMSLDLAARFTRGHNMPLENEAGTQEAGSVLLLSAEDDLADTVRPRLEALGADMAKVYSLQAVFVLGEQGSQKVEDLPAIPRDLPLIELIVRTEAIRYIVIDPFMAYLTPNAYKDQDVRRAMAPLARLCEQTGAACLILRHLIKATGVSAIHKGGGSIGIIGASRSGMYVGEHPDDRDTFCLAQSKSNLGARSPTLLYHLEPVEGTDVARVVWDGTCDLTADDLIDARPARAAPGAAKRAEDVILSILSDHVSHSRDEIVTSAHSQGIGRNATDNALKHLEDTRRITSERTGKGGTKQFTDTGNP